MHQSYLVARRRVALQPAQAPLQRRVWRVLAVQVVAELAYLMQSRGFLIPGQEVQALLWRTDRVDARQLRAEALGQLAAVAAIATVLDHQVRGGGAADAPHDEERPADHLAILAQPQRLGHSHSGVEGRPEQGVLLRPAVTD
ncbi:hypothetical protein D3C78_288700 [compost metagenome]